MLAGLASTTRAGRQQPQPGRPELDLGLNWSAARGKHDSSAVALSSGTLDSPGRSAAAGGFRFKERRQPFAGSGYSTHLSRRVHTHTFTGLPRWLKAGAQMLAASQTHERIFSRSGHTDVERGT